MWTSRPWAFDPMPTGQMIIDVRLPRYDVQVAALSIVAADPVTTCRAAGHATFRCRSPLC